MANGIGAMKTYTVAYEINANIAGAETQISKLAQTFAALTRDFNYVNGAATAFRQTLNGLQSFHIDSKKMTSDFTNALSAMKTQVRTFAEEVSAMMSAAMNGTYRRSAGVSSQGANTNRIIQGQREMTKRELQALKREQQTASRQQGSTVFSKMGDQAYLKQVKDAAASFRAISSSMQRLSKVGKVNLQVNYGRTLTNIAKVNAALAALAAGKTVTISANITPAIEAINILKAELRSLGGNVRVGSSGNSTSPRQAARNFGMMRNALRTLGGLQSGSIALGQLSNQNVHNMPSGGSVQQSTSIPGVTTTARTGGSNSDWAIYSAQQHVRAKRLSNEYGAKVAQQENAYHNQRQKDLEKAFGATPATTKTKSSSLSPDAAYAKHAREMAEWDAKKYNYNKKEEKKQAQREHARKQKELEETFGVKKGGASAKPESFYTRLRKDWYPFTGNTSFGARTPAVVEMAKGMGMMMAVGGAMSAVGSSFSQAMEYQNTMATTRAILERGNGRFSPSSFNQMENTVRNVGIKTKFSAPEVANAARFMAMAGYDIPAINAAIRPVADVALIGDTDLGETADKLTNVMTTFGVKPNQMRDMADIMTTTFTRSNTDMMMLAESAKYAGGIVNLYGRMNKNNFADFMAMVGVLGNAGIQASSAGTTIRMMYNNLMQPNKNQRAALQRYGIKTRNGDGTPLEMVDIISQLAQLDPKILPDAMGQMFRITAQPGAAALATHIGDLNNLMHANRAAAGSGISNAIATEKQNTIQGLWAQVTSTFTEAIVKAFEQKSGGWAGQLSALRDYLAKPETTKMLGNVLDLFTGIMKVMANLAQFWAWLYNLAPGLIKSIMLVQLLAKQFGSLMAIFVQGVSLFSKVGQLFGITSLFGSGAATANVTGTAANVAYSTGAWTGSAAAGASAGTGVKAALLGGPALGILAAGAAIVASLWNTASKISRVNEQLKLMAENKWLSEFESTASQNSISAAMSVGNIDAIQLGYRKQIDENAAPLSLEGNKTVQELANLDINNILASQIRGGYVNGFERYLPTPLVERVSSMANLIKGPTMGSAVRTDSSIRARNLGIIAQWGKLATEQPEVQKAIEDIYRAFYIDKDQNKANAILNAFTPNNKLPSMGDMVGNLSTDKLLSLDPTKYYEYGYAQYQYLKEQMDKMNPLWSRDIVRSLVRGGAKNKNWNAHEILANYIQGTPIAGPNGTHHVADFTDRGTIDWAKLAEQMGGVSISYQNRMDYIAELYKRLSLDPEINKFPELLDLLKKYLPIIAGDSMLDAPIKIATKMTDAVNSVLVKFGLKKAVKVDGNGNVTTTTTGTSQKEYQSTYDRTSSRPTQVIINIENLAKFDHTAISGSSDQASMVEAIENKLAEAIAMLSAQALTETGSVISQGYA